MNSHAVLVFDGVCNLCNWAVRFIIARDRREYFRFASLQSESGAEFLRDCEPVTGGVDTDTVVLVEDGKCFTRSTAALRVLRRLSPWWRWLYFLILVPRPLRDMIYRVIARNRYRWFGRKEQCMIPTPGIQNRFL